MKFLFYVVLLCANICIAQQTDIIWAKPVRVTINGNSITKSQNGQKASAKSENILDANTNGWAEFKVTETGVRLGFGFIKSTSNNNEVDGEIDFANMDYSIQLFNNNTVKIYKEGDLFGQFGTYSVGSIFRIERLNNQIKFYKNGVLLTTITNSGIPSKSFVVNGVIQSNGSSITLAKSSFVKPLTMTSSVTDVHCQSATNLGSISISVSGGMQPYTYLWSNGVTSASLNSIKSGIYSLVLTDATNKTIKQTFTVLNCVDWTDATGVTISGTVLTKTATTLWGNAGSASENVLQGGIDGYMQFTPGGNIKFSAIGLTFLNTDNDYKSIDYAFLIDNKRLFIFSSGKLQGDFGRLRNTDVLKIERKAETILYYKNDIIVFKDATKPEMDLVVDVALNKKNDFFEDVKTTFFQKPSLTSVVKNAEFESILGSINLAPKGGYAPYFFDWNNISIPTASAILSMLRAQDSTSVIDTNLIKIKINQLRSNSTLANLQPGFYPVTISDQLNQSAKIMAVIGTKVSWLNTQGVTTKTEPIPSRKNEGVLLFYDKGENVIQETETFDPNNTYAIANNFIFPTFDNYIEFTVPSIRDVSMVGLTKKTLNIIAGKEGYYDLPFFEFTGKEEFLINLDNQKIYSSKFQSGDVFAMANDVANKKINFYHNGKLVSTNDFSKSMLSEELLWFKVSLRSQRAGITNIVMKTAPPSPGLNPISFYTATSAIKDAYCGNPCSGTLDVAVNVIFLSTPVRYELYNLSNNAIVNTINYTGGLNHAVFTNLCAGKYYVKYYFINTFSSTQGSITTSLTSPFEVAYMPDWANNVNVLTDPIDHSLTKNAGASVVLQWDAGASSINKLLSTDNGWIEWRASTLGVLGGVNGVGFSDADSDQNINTIDYGIGMIGLFNFYILLSNQTIFDATIGGLGTPLNIFGSNTANAVFRLTKDLPSNTIKLTINNQLIGSFPITSPSDLIYDASLQFMSGVIKHPRASFGCSELIFQHAVLQNRLDGHYYNLQNHRLTFTVDGEYTLSNLNYKVYDYSQAVIASNTISFGLLNKPSLELGDNRYDLNCSSFPAGYYTLEVTNEKNEKLYLRFKR